MSSYAPLPAIPCQNTHNEAGAMIADVFDVDVRRDKERVHFGSVVNNGDWGHREVSGNDTVMIEMRNVPVELVVQIGRLLKDALHLRAG